jgi:hypothetical protein
MIAFLLASLALSDCDTEGIHVEFGKAEHDLAEAYYDSASDSGTHFIVFTGSFMPTSDGVHRFTVTCETYFTSVGYDAVAHLEWDGEVVDSGKDSWDWTSNLHKDYRYSFRVATDDNFYWATLRLAVALPTGESFTVNQKYADTCTVSGCRNLSLTRDQNCQAPARAKIPIPPKKRAAQPGWQPSGSRYARAVAVAVALAGVAVVAIVIVLVVVVVRRRRPAAELQDGLLAGAETVRC